MLSKLRDLFKPKSPDPAAGEALLQQAQSLHKEGKLEQAVALYSQCIALSPVAAEPHYKRANALNALGRHEQALEDYNQALAANPSHAHAACNRGSVLESLGRYTEALVSLDRALELNPDDAFAHYNRGSVLKNLERHEDALQAYDSAIRSNDQFAAAYVNRGGILQKLQRHEAALATFQRALELNPTLAEAVQGRGASLFHLQREEEALEAFNQAIALKPNLAAAFAGRGALLHGLDRFAEAIADYRTAVALEPAAATLNNLASALMHINQYNAAIACFDQALAREPDHPNLRGNRRMALMRTSLWDEFAEDRVRLEQGVSERKPVCNPMTLATVSDSVALLRTVAEVWVQTQVEALCEADRSRLPQLPRRPRSDKIRIGYFSSDLRAHPVAALTVGLFEQHDRAKFEVTAFAFGPPANDSMLARLVPAFDHFVDVRRKSDLEVVRMARELGIDIAVDLNGHTAYARTGIFALRAAPIQVNFLGYPGTLGASFMDYLIADARVVPPQLQRHYAEQIAYLPGCFMPFDARCRPAERIFSRAEQGLPATGVVFSCFNNNNKIIPNVFDRWMRILQSTGNSVLWLARANDTVVGNLHREAAHRGINADRLIFAPRLESPEDHLARLRLGDLFLDTFPYNAHTTALDSLRAGVPLLTCPGDSFASRVAASLLQTVGLPELIAGSPAEYEAIAIALANDPPRLAQLRRRLSENSTSLFDTTRYTRNLEALYAAMYERHQAGTPPASLSCTTQANGV